MPRDKKVPTKRAGFSESFGASILPAERGPESSEEREWYEYGPYMPDTVYLGQSRIAGAGIGAFAAKAIPAGTILGRYEGRIVPPTTVGDYVLEHPAGFAIDAQDTRYGSWTRFINTFQWAGVAYARPNVEFVMGIDTEGHQGIYVRSLRDISRMEELYVDYGPNYNYHGPYVDVKRLM